MREKPVTFCVFIAICSINNTQYHYYLYYYYNIIITTILQRYINLRFRSNLFCGDCISFLFLNYG